MESMMIVLWINLKQIQQFADQAKVYFKIKLNIFFKKKEKRQQ